MEESFSEEDWGWIARHVPTWTRLVKRGMDILGSFFALLFFSPIILLVAMAVKIDSTGTVFFHQERGGYLGKPFKVCKFRTMVHNASELGGFDTSQRDPRITRVGKLLREWSLDELPQFWNVLKGEMSLIGPRPTLLYQIKNYTPRQKRRLLMKPGMSGLAVVKGRNLLSWPEKIELDLQYIENFSILNDCKLLWKTVELVFSRKGVYGDAGV